MKFVALGVLALALVAGAFVQAEDKKTSPYEVETIKAVAYYEGKDADKVRHKLDMYLPKDAKGYPVFFFIHGGGWRGGSKDGFGKHGQTFAKNGIGFVSINYRLTPATKHPGHIEDVARAFAWTRADLAKRGANIEQIYISGHSAGGHLAALLATDEKYLKAHKLSLKDIKGVVPISGVFRVGGMRGVFDKEDAKTASPLTHVKEGLPPFLIFYADKEIAGLGRQAEQFGKALQEVKVDATVKMIADRDHGSIMRKASSADDEVTKAIFAFIRKNGGLKDEKKEKPDK